jgi:outer membrane protein OmpA-like peptidoglycan-associated protein
MGYEYGMTATAQDYAFFSAHYTPPDTAIYKEISYDVYLTPVDTNALAVNTGTGGNEDDPTIIPLNNIFFDFNLATLRNESTTELKNIVAFLKQYPKLKVEISGHTDSVGTEAYNKNLSQQRANAVRDYIVKNGVPAVRITAKGYGATLPVAANDTEENRQKNRRTEFRILNKKK